MGRIQTEDMLIGLTGSATEHIKNVIKLFGKPMNKQDIRKEKLNKIFWNNLDIAGIEHGNFERPVKAKIQGEIEQFIEEEIQHAIAQERKEIVEIIEEITNYDHSKCPIKETCIGYQSAVSDILNNLSKKSE